jgi:hypothetical protein
MPTFRNSFKVRAACGAAATFMGLSMIAVSAHTVRGLTEPSSTAFVGSPTAGSDLPVPIAWGTLPTRFDSGLSVACFLVSNTTLRPEGSEWPRLTAFGFELPGTRSGFTLLSPQGEGWEVMENLDVATPRGTFTVDFALVAPVNPMGRSTAGNFDQLLGLPPNQPSGRPDGTPFCVAGPFPAGLSIEQIIDGVVVRFHGVQPHGPSIDLGLWDNPMRTVPLYP